MAEAFGGHPELWVVDPPPDQGPEGNALRRGASRGSSSVTSAKRTKTARTGLHGSVGGMPQPHRIGERRRAEALLRLRGWWDGRRTGGVVEPESAVKTRPAEWGDRPDGP